MTRAIAATVYCAIVTAAAIAQSGSEGWLDRPLTSWNSSANTIPRAQPAEDEPVAEVAAERSHRCR